MRSRRKKHQPRTATTIAPMMPPANPGVLTREYFGDAVPQNENHRTHYGRSLDLTRIDLCIRQANNGLMRNITDLGRETISLDGHLSALLQKRLNRLAALDWDLQPAAGEYVDTDKAEFYASFVRSQLEALPRFRDIIIDLDWALFDGRAAHELDWRYFAGAWHVIDMYWLHPRRLSFGPCRDLRVVDANRDSYGFSDVGFPIEQVPYKFLTYKPRIFNDYQEREGLLIRALYWSFFQRASTRERLMLQEICVRPWRVLTFENGASIMNVDAVRDAFETVKNLGYNNAARMPQGMKLDVISPPIGGGQLSADIIDHAQKVLSKLVLGSTGTTDAVSTGLGSSIGNAHLSEEDLIIWSDARRLAEAIEDQLTDAIIAVNFGPTELDHAPRFIFRTEPPLDREAEANRLAKALELGIPVTLEEGREKLGVQEVREGEPYLKKVQREVPLGQLAPPPANEVIYPIGQAPMPGEIVDAPLPANNLPGGGAPDLPPAALPPSTTPPPALPAAAASAELDADEDEPDAVAALAERMTELGLTECEHGKKNRCLWCGVERERDVELDADGTPRWIKKWRPIKKSVAPAA